MLRVVEFGGRRYEYSWWDGQLLKGTPESPAAWDLETRLIKPVREPRDNELPEDVPTDPLDVPEPALGMAASADGQLVLIHPTRLGEFVHRHRQQHLVGHNLAFDFWVTVKANERPVRKRLFEMGSAGLLHDTMILDMLLQLARGKYRKIGHGKRAGDDEKVIATNLGVLATEYGLGDEVDKASPYRLRFGELIGLTEAEIDAHPEADGFLTYALIDVLATQAVYPKQREEAVGWMRRAGWNQKGPKTKCEILPTALKDYGPLSERIQVVGSIALAELSRTPLRIDQQKRQEFEDAARARYDSAMATVLKTSPNLFKKSKAIYRVRVVDGVKTKVCIRESAPVFTKGSGVPQKDDKVLVETLTRIAADLDVKPPRSDGKKQGVSRSTKAWVKYADRSEFIAAWVDLENAGKLLQFLAQLNAPAVFSRYNALLRTGRTSAGAYRSGGELVLPSLNIQQMKRDDPDHPDRSLRNLFLPPDGKLWFECDYSYLEIRSLAAVALALFGWSKMAEAVVAHTKDGGADPHQRTAASILGVTLDEFFRRDKLDQDRYRQQAKCANFGYGGGLGADTFVTYAAGAGTKITKTEAKAIKKAWLETYPEMKLYLSDLLDDAMKWQTGTRAIPRLTWLQKKRISDFLKDKAARAKFSATEAEFVWDTLEWIASRKKDTDALEDIEKREVTGRVKDLVNYRSCTLTGRVRNGTIYTSTANTRFQGVAADGAKLALYRLFAEGFEVLNFVHDSFSVAVNPATAKRDCKRVEQIMVEEMERVFEGTVPVAVKGVLADRWSKG